MMMRTDAERSAVVAVAKKLEEVLARLGEASTYPVLEGVLEEVEARISEVRDPAYREQAERLGAAGFPTITGKRLRVRWPASVANTVMSAHTPGPWFVRDYTDIVSAEGSVARTSGRCRDSHDADARLIAAAPELLEALEMLQPLYWDDPDGAGVAAAAAACRAAIAKARGGK